MFYFYFLLCAQFLIVFYPYAIFNVVKSIDNLKVPPSGYFFTEICVRSTFFLIAPSFVSAVSYSVLYCSSLKDQKGLVAVATLLYIFFVFLST